MAKELVELQWVEDLLPTGYVRKRMFGGFGYYLQNLMILTLFESQNDYTYRGKTYDFELWSGCLFPCDRENHSAILKDYPYLIQHPILTKWLYLPSQTEDFEDKVSEILQQIRKRNPLWGTIPKEKNKSMTRKKTTLPNRAENLKELKDKKNKANKTNTKISSKDKNDEFGLKNHKPTKIPMLFRDETPEDVFAQARKISDLKNLGVTAEKDFARAGIKTAAQFQKMGWKKALQKLAQKNPKHRHSLYAYALIGALHNKDWNGISQEDKAEARAFVQSLPRPSQKRKKM